MRLHRRVRIVRGAHRSGAVAALALAASVALAEGDPSQPGAYCKLPKPGEQPACLAPAQAQYQDFFAGLEEGELSDEAAAQLEADVAEGANAANRYEALSSLSYGYFQLARAAAAAPSSEPDPEVARRLERWNDLLERAYQTSGGDERYREAVREAALDLGANAPPLVLRCRDENGRFTECTGTEAVLRSIDSARQQAGLRGALTRLLQSIFGGPDS